jgi:hypothetical protein
MDSAKAPVNLVKVTRVLGRTGTRNFRISPQEEEKEEEKGRSQGIVEDATLLERMTG